MKNGIARLLIAIFVIIMLGEIFAYIWKNYPDYFPTWAIEYRVKRITQQNKDFIDQLILLEKNAREGNMQAYIHRIKTILDYENFLKYHKKFITQRLELRNAISIELDRALYFFDPTFDKKVKQIAEEEKDQDSIVHSLSKYIHMINENG